MSIKPVETVNVFSDQKTLDQNLGHSTSYLTNPFKFNHLTGFNWHFWRQTNRVSQNASHRETKVQKI